MPYTSPLVSILMTVFNREKYIGEAIESVINSSYQNWELIIVDDKSEDNSVEIAKNYAKKDKRIAVHINNLNIGDYPNRNKAASYAKGKYLKYLDADDILYKYSLSYMVEAMENNQVAALGISYNRIDDIYPYPSVSNPIETYYSEYLGKSILGCGPSASIINRGIFNEFEGFSGKPYIGDHELWLKISTKYSIVKLQPSLVWWRIHPEQQISLERKNINIINIRYKLRLNTLTDNKNLFSKEEYIIALKKLKQHHARGLLRRLLLNGEFRNFLKLYRLSELSLLELIKGFKSYE